MPDVEAPTAPTADPFELATAAAIADIRAALDATAGAYEEHSGAVGHGTIRLRDPSAPPQPAAIDEPDEVAGEATPPDEVAADAAPAASAAPSTAVGHGAIRLRG
jgi:hypothetical protein